MTQANWYTWHDAYENPDSWQAQRLVRVQGQIREALDAAPAGPLRVLAMVAGQGRDLLPVLAEHPRRDDVTARLVELDPGNAEDARTTAAKLGLTGVEVITGDAARTDHYVDFVPADLVLICGLFIHIVDEDVQRVVRAAAAMTKRGGRVIWTRGRTEPDAIPAIATWFAENGFEEIWCTAPEIQFAVVTSRHLADPPPLAAGATLFTFVGIHELRRRRETAAAD